MAIGLAASYLFALPPSQVFDSLFKEQANEGIEVCRR